MKSEYVLKNKIGYDGLKKDLVLEILSRGAKNIGSFITGNLSVGDFSKYIKDEAEKYQIKPNEFLDFLETYYICDASAYTDGVLDDFKDKLGEERYSKIKKFYKIDSQSQQPGAGVTDWFKQKDENISFRNNQRFGDHKMKDWLEELRRRLV